MKEKFKSYSFWMSVSAGVVLVINNIGKVFGFSISNEVVTEIVDSVCGVLILFGVLSMNNKDEKNAIENFGEETEVKEQENAFKNNILDKTTRKTQKSTKKASQNAEDFEKTNHEIDNEIEE